MTHDSLPSLGLLRGPVRPSGARRVVRKLLPALCVLGLTPAAPLVAQAGPLAAQPASAPGMAQAVPASAPQVQAALDALCDEWAARNPVDATELGIHAYDEQIDDLSQQGIRAEISWLQTWQAKLAMIQEATLPQGLRLDLKLAQQAIRARLYQRGDAQDHRRRPGVYLRLAAESVNSLIKRSFATPAERLAHVLVRLQKVPALMQIAERNLDATAPVAPVSIEITLSDLEATRRFFLSDVPAAFPEVTDAPTQAALKKHSQAAADSLARFRDFLKKRAATAKGTYILGSEAFRQRLAAVEMIDEPLEVLTQRAEAEMQRLLTAFSATAAKIDAKKPASDVQLDMQKDHPQPGQIIAETLAQLSGQQRFLVDRGIVSLPSMVLPMVRETPPFMRATTLASMDTPGPYDSAKEAYYYVTLPASDWKPEKVEDFLRGAYNRPLIDVVTIHEAFPGHYVQYLWQPKLSKVRQFFGVVHNSEGWAHYTEQMMLDEGYGNANPRLRLAQLQDALLRASRFVVALRMHTTPQGLTVEQAMDYFHTVGLQTKEVARMEALRGTQDPLYMVYTYGKLEIMRLRDEVKAQRGARYSLRAFHDELLSYGRAPLRLIRQELLAPKP